MRHLTAGQLIDIAEGTRGDASARHLASCDRCRRQLADIRAMMAAAANADVPEPSPLFWDHFSARVRGAIASEGAPGRLTWLDRWSWSGLVVPLSIGAMAVIVIVAVLTVGVGRPEKSPPAIASAADGAALVEAGVVADDPSLDLVADLTADIDWDTSGEVGLTTREGAADRAVTQLTEGERVELQRLLQQELRRSGD